MNRAHLYAAAAALAAPLVLARVLASPGPAPASLALPAPVPAPATPARSATSPPAPTPTRRPPTPSELRAAVAALDAVRAAAFADPASGDPSSWADPSCACHAEDLRRLRDLARSRLALRGHRVTLDALTLAAPPTPDRADLLLTDRAAGYAAVDPSGRAVSRWPASGPRRWRVTLVRTSGRWRYGSVARAP